MSWWKKAISTATGGAVNLEKGPKMPSSLTNPDVEQKRTVGKTQQAGGGQIHFNTEETFMGPANSGNAQPSQGEAQQKPHPTLENFYKNLGSQPQQQSQNKLRNFYTGLQSKINPRMGEGGWRSDAAKRLIKYE